MELSKIQQDNSKADIFSSTHESTDNEVVSIEECKQYFQKFNLTDKRIIDIKNNLIGIVNGIINSYLDDFRK
jgi:hypothetical protein